MRYLCRQRSSGVDVFPEVQSAWWPNLMLVGRRRLSMLAALLIVALFAPWSPAFPQAAARDGFARLPDVTLHYVDWGGTRPLPLPDPPGTLGQIVRASRLSDSDYTKVSAPALALFVVYDQAYIPADAYAELRARLIKRWEEYGRPSSSGASRISSATCATAKSSNSTKLNMPIFCGPVRCRLALSARCADSCSTRRESRIAGSPRTVESC